MSADPSLSSIGVQANQQMFLFGGVSPWRTDLGLSGREITSCLRADYEV